MFRYSNRMGRAYDDEHRNVDSVLFPISRTRAANVVLNFPARCTEREAIEAAERYLSQPLTEGHFFQVRHDLPDKIEWAEAREAYRCRGGCLGAATQLDATRFVEDGLLWLAPGS